MSDLSLFFGQFIRRPSEIRSVIPTGRATAREMARIVTPQMQAVAEIGAGTGTVTKAILERGLAPEKLDLYELNAAFCVYLQEQFPKTKVHNCPAQEMVNREGAPLDAVISGVPVLPMPDELQAAIIGAALTAMRPGAPFVQITYGPNSPVSERVQKQFNLTYRRSRRIWANFPPARVYVYRQDVTAPR